MRTLVQITLGVTLVAGLTVTTPSATASTTVECGQKVIAHRGGTEKYAENSLSAFKYALDKGATSLETDVRFYGYEPVLSHDPVTDWSRPTRLRNLMPLGADEYLLELKVNPTSGQWKRFNEIVAPYKTKIKVTSFERSWIKEAQSYGYKTALIEGANSYKETGFQYVSKIKPYGSTYIKSQYGVTWSRAKYWSSNGLGIYAWTVNTKTHWKWLDGYGTMVDGIITDKPGAYLDWQRAGCLF